MDEDLLWLGLLAFGAWWFYSQQPGSASVSVADDGSGGGPADQGVVSNMGWLNTWAEAIARQEGFYVPGKRPNRNHNPGDLKFMGQPGAVGQDSGGFAIFPDDVTGWSALNRQLAKYVRTFSGYNLLQIMSHYLGQHGDVPTIDSQGNAIDYGNKVAAALGVPAGTTLGQLAAGVIG